MALKLKHSPLQKLSVDNIYNAFIALGPQEKIVALAVSGIAFLIILILPIWFAVGKIHSMEKVISGSQTEQQEIIEKIRELKKVEAEEKALEAQFGGKAGSLTTTVESVATDSGVRENIQSMKERPSQEGDVLEETTVELSLRGVSLEQLIDFLYTVENDQKVLMRIKKLQITPKYKAKNVLDASCDLVTYSIRREEQ